MILCYILLLTEILFVNFLYTPLFISPWTTALFPMRLQASSSLQGLLIVALLGTLYSRVGEGGAPLILPWMSLSSICVVFWHLLSWVPLTCLSQWEQLLLPAPAFPDSPYQSCTVLFIIFSVLWTRKSYFTLLFMSLFSFLFAYEWAQYVFAYVDGGQRLLQAQPISILFTKAGSLTWIQSSQTQLVKLPRLGSYLLGWLPLLPDI